MPDIEIPVEDLLWEEEGAALDFKQEQYKFINANDYEKSELLKDILTFANSWRRHTAYILIGVKDIKGSRGKIVGINEELDDAKLQQFVNSKTQKPISFSYHVVSVDNFKIGVIRIPVQNRPVFLSKDYGKLKKDTVYLRRGSSTDKANPDEIYKMGYSETSISKEVPSISFEFANRRDRKAFGKTTNLSTTFLNTPPKPEIPNFSEGNQRGPFSLPFASSLIPNKDFYRDLVEYFFIHKAVAELTFLIKNNSGRTLSDIRVELSVNTQDGVIGFLRASDLPSMPESHYDRFFPRSDLYSTELGVLGKRSLEIQNLSDSVFIEIPFEKVQPKQTAFSEDSLYILCASSLECIVDATIYSDEINEPIKQNLSITCEVNYQDGSLESIKKLYREYLMVHRGRSSV